MRGKIFLLGAMCGSMCLFLTAAEEDPERPPDARQLKHDVVVTATRVETPEREVASSVTVLTRADLERTKRTTVLEALQDIAGLTVQQNGPASAAASVMVRGANSEHTLVLLDGVALNEPMTPSRSFDWAHLRLEAVERVEIIRGPQSTLFGSDALGGIIHIITRKGSGKTALRFSTHGGSYRTLSAAAGVGGSSGRGHFSLDVSYAQSAGFSAASSAYPGNAERDGSTELALAGRAGYALRENIGLELIIRRQSGRADLDNFGGPWGDDPDSRQDHGLWLLKAEARAVLLKNRWDQQLSWSLVDQNRTYANPADDLHPLDSERGRFESREWTLDWQHSVYVHASNTLTLGLEFQREEGRSEYAATSAWGDSGSDFPRRSAGTASLYAQDLVRLAGRFFASAGVRLDRHSQFGSALTYRLAPAFLIKESGTKLKMTLGTGFKSPSLYQLYAPGTLWGPIGNVSLEPETSLGWDAGIEQEIAGGTVRLGLTYFANDFRNLIQFDYLRGYSNMGRADSRGLEATALAQLSPGWSFSAAYARTETRDRDTGEPLLRRPKHRLSAGLAGAFLRKGHARIGLLYVGMREDMAYIGYSAQRVRLPAHTLLDAVLSWKAWPGGEVFLRLDNILDEVYETVYGYGMPRSSVYAGLSLAL